jgi:hypothetical protein
MVAASRGRLVTRSEMAPPIAEAVRLSPALSRANHGVFGSFPQPPSPLPAGERSILAEGEDRVRGVGWLQQAPVPPHLTPPLSPQGTVAKVNDFPGSIRFCSFFDSEMSGKIRLLQQSPQGRGRSKRLARSQMRPPGRVGERDNKRGARGGAHPGAAVGHGREVIAVSPWHRKGSSVACSTATRS